MSALAVIIASASALSAAPAHVPVQGYLTDAAGTPLAGSHDITLTLYDADVGGATLFSETQTVLVEGGLATIYLGAESSFDLAVFRDNGAVYLGIQIDSDAEMTPRFPVGSAPFAAYAQYAGTAENVAGGTVDATSIAVDGSPIVDATGAWVGAAPPDTLGTLSCAQGQVAQLTASGWDCATVGADTLAALPCVADDLPVFNGSTWSCVARTSLGTALTETEVEAFVTNEALDLFAGSQVGGAAISVEGHGHAGEDITSGTVAYGRLPVGTAADQVAQGSHSHSDYAPMTYPTARYLAGSSTSDNPTSISIMCPGGAKASGGGCQCMGTADVAMKASYPIEAADDTAEDGDIVFGWGCTCVDSEGSDITPAVWAVCGEQP